MEADPAGQFCEQTPDAIVAIAPNGNVVHWNKAAEGIFGYERDEAIGRPLADLIIPPDHAEELQAQLRQALAGDLSVYEAVRRRKDGSLAHMCVSMTAIHDDGGGLRHYLSFEKDVTHSKFLRDDHC